MRRRRSLITKKQIDGLYKIDRSGRLAWGIFGVACLGIAIFFACIDKSVAFLSIPFFVISTIVFIWIICKSIKLRKQEQHLQQAMLQSNIHDIQSLSPIEFEDWFARMFRMRGYKATLTPHSNDYGIDVLLEQGETKIGVQVKKYSTNVGVSAVQEVISGMRYYDCTDGWVITSADDFTKQAKILAKKAGIKLYAYNELAILLAETKQQSK